MDTIKFVLFAMYRAQIIGNYHRAITTFVRNRGFINKRKKWHSRSLNSIRISLATMPLLPPLYFNVLTACLDNNRACFLQLSIQDFLFFPCLVLFTLMCI